MCSKKDYLLMTVYNRCKQMSSSLELGEELAGISTRRVLALNLQDVETDSLGEGTRKGD